MKTLVAPESTNEFTDLISAVSIVSTVTFNFKAFDSSSREEMTSQDGSFCSQQGQKCRAGSGVGTSFSFSTVSFISGNISTGKIEKWLWVDSEGILFTHCLLENPLVRILSEQGQMVLVKLHRVGLDDLVASLLVRLWKGSVHQIDPDTPC